MKQLFVEELESRNLLSVTGFDHLLHRAPDSGHSDSDPIAHFSGRSFGDSSSPVRYQTDMPAQPNFISVEPGGNFGNLAPAGRYQAGFPARLNLPGSERVDDLASSLTSRGEDTVEFIVVPPRISMDVSGLLDGPLLSGSTVRQSLAAALSSGPISTVPFLLQVALAANQRAPASDLTAVVVVTAAEAGNAVAAGSTEAVASALSSKASTPIASRTDSLAAGAFRNVGTTIFNSNSSVRTGADGLAGDSLLERIPSLPPVPQPPALELPQSPLAQSIRGGLASLPQFADLMTGISTLNLDRIEQGMANFVISLESASSPAVTEHQRDLYPWMLAALVTAIACELTRRQLKKTAAMDGVDLATLPIAPWELPRESENGRTAR